MGNTVVYTNGIDRALVINHDGMVTPLGFDSIPPTPQSEGPQPPLKGSGKSTSSTGNYFAGYPNDFGYSWPGKIGSVGDMLDGQTGALLSGGWYYACQWEDVFGNVSQPSAPSNLVSVETIQSNPYDPSAEDSDTSILTELSDLTRQFLVRIEGDAPSHCVAVWLHRTSDMKQGGDTFRELTRVPGNRQFFYPDNVPDSALGLPMLDTTAVPVFRVMCTHQGCLVIGNTVADPGIVRRSQTGLPGTFLKSDFIYPDSGGSEVTGLASHAGKLLAFTENSVYELRDFQVPIPLAQGIGCVAQRSIKAMSDGTLVWLARDGFYGMTPDGVVRHLSKGIDRTVRNYVNRARARAAVAVVDPNTSEYRCAVCPAGESRQTLILTYDGKAWKRQQLGLHISDWCQTDDYRQYVLASVEDHSPSGSSDFGRGSLSYTPNVFVMDRETPYYELPTRELIYRSGWIRGDSVGLSPIHVRTMYIGLKDSWDGNFTVRFYRNGSWSEVVSMADVRAVGPDDGSGLVSDIAGSAVIGKAKTHDPRLFFRQIPVGLENASTWAFEIHAFSPTRLNIASFVFDVTVASQGNARSRTPFKSDV
jgi:hypothetical protein